MEVHEQANNGAALGHFRQTKELIRKAAELVSPSESQATRRQLVVQGGIAEALFGKCIPHRSTQGPIVASLCDPAAAKKLAEQDPTGKVLNKLSGATFSMVRVEVEMPSDFYDFRKLP